MSITIKVTWRDIQRANDKWDSSYVSSNYCPISQAVRRQFSTEYVCTYSDSIDFDDGYIYELPKAAQEFALAFDERSHPSPITFVVEEA